MTTNRLMWQDWIPLGSMLGALMLLAIAGCGLLPGPTPPEPPEPPHNEACQALIDAGLPWCSETDPPMTCGECIHNPTNDPKHCEMAPECAPPPLPLPQCQTFMNRGGSVAIFDNDCDCYFGEEWVACEPDPPPPGECVFYGDDENGDHWKAWTPGQRPTRHYDEYRKGVNAAGDTCGKPPMESLRAIAAAINEQGVCAKQEHDSVSILRSSDGFYEEWHAIYFGNGCSIDGTNAHKATWEYLGPKADSCPLPHPDLKRMKFNTHERGSHLDTTLTTNYQCEFCEAIGLGEHGGRPRCGCPVRPECGPNAPPDYICHDRAACEAELCDQKWQCNGVAVDGWRGNQAQTNCRGHWKTWCSAQGSTAIAEGTR